MDNTNKRSVIVWLSSAKEGVGKNGKPYKIYNGTVDLGEGKTFDVSGFESTSKDEKTKYIKMFEKETYVKPEEAKKEF